MVDPKDTYVLIGKENCDFCKKAKILLNENKKTIIEIPFDENLLSESMYWSENGKPKEGNLKTFLEGKEHKTVPIIFRQSEKGDIKFQFIENTFSFIGGFDNLNFTTYQMSMSSRKSTKRQMSKHKLKTSRRRKAKITCRSRRRYPAKRSRSRSSPSKKSRKKI